jgi:hypothetical protein
MAKKAKKLKQAIYDVTIGERDLQSDNWRSKRVLATDARAAMWKVKLAESEYYAEVRMVARAD